MPRLNTLTDLYEPLPPGHIRLLDLSDDNDQDGQISCSLFTVSLDSAPAYAALSYAWEEWDDIDHPSKQECHILVNNDYPVKIQRNLYNAISTLRDMIRGDGVMLWVDFICINQTDLDERAHQVRLMRHVYEEAAYVIAWLGLPHQDEEIIEAIEMMKFFDTLRREDESSDELGLRLLTERPGFPKDASTIQAWEGLKYLYSRRFWTRTWVYQEASVHRVVFFCGTYHFHSRHLTKTYTTAIDFGKLPDFPARFRFDSHANSQVGIMVRALNNRAERHRKPDQHNLSTLLALVYGLRTTDATDLRDKIFAAMPYATDLSGSGLTIDYSKDLVSVYCDMAAFYIVQKRSLEILGYVYNRGNHPNREEQDQNPLLKPHLPSWVPDWRYRLDITPLNKTAILGPDYGIIYNPCPGTTIDAYPSPDNRELYIRGFVVDKLACLAPPGTTTHNNAADLAIAKAHLREHDPTLPFTDEDFLRTTTCDAHYDWDDDNCTHYNFRRPSASKISELQGKDLDIFLNKEESVQCICIFGRMGSTKKGRKLGLFPHGATEGDLVVALFGGNTLYVLGPDQGVDKEKGERRRYQFIGECYVDGMMDGEAMDESDV
ncbi:hypothetical protein PRZ48_007963 [Zasmidium cellare]|uniref:Heterokaryon incompatibility domain-containing protein n=1 Tax=Zasmidium cellare TaxID=395010 RepID=A0ABR0EEA2_ZASCE|nr:hypothetical protein PRZ48_007963 [Zasmidium cellare]